MEINEIIIIRGKHVDLNESFYEESLRVLNNLTLVLIKFTLINNSKLNIIVL